MGKLFTTARGGHYHREGAVDGWLLGAAQPLLGQLSAEEVSVNSIINAAISAPLARVAITDIGQKA